MPSNDSLGGKKSLVYRGIPQKGGCQPEAISSGTGLGGRMRSHPVVQRLKQEIGRFTIVGAANALLTFLIFTTLLKILAVDYHAALLVSWLCGVIFSYCLSFVWVFSQPDRLVFDFRFVKFLVTGLLSITLNVAGLHLLVEHTGGDPFWLQIALVPFVVGFNFSAAKFWSLTRRDG